MQLVIVLLLKMQKDRFLVLRNFTIEPIFSEIEEKFNTKKIKPIFDISGYEDSYTSLINKGKKKMLNYKACILMLCIDSFFHGKKKVNKKILKDEITNQYKKIIENLLNKNVKNIFIFYFSKGMFNKVEISSISKVLNKISFGRDNIKIIELNKEMKWFDKPKDILSKRSWLQSMFPFNGHGIKVLSFIIFRKLIQLYQSQIKLILLDADNTLWNGIIDEVGLKKINIKKKLIDYKKFQKNLLELKKKGMMLGIVSKNEKQNIIKAFRYNERKMILRLKDFSIISANWKPKFENIIETTKKLKISIDQTIFIDDSRFEIESLKKTIKRLEVIRINEYKNFTNNINFIFKNLTKVTKEDKKRFELYQIEEKRVDQRKNSKDFEDYVTNLNIRLTIKRNNKKNIPRLSQLTQRTNQFNSTTLRLSEKQIKKIIQDKNIDLFECYAEDKFGIYGTIGVIIVDKSKNNLIIKNFLMSCRALGRSIEKYFFEQICKYYKDNSFNIFIEYFKSEKNRLFYQFAEKNFKKIKNKNKFILYKFSKPIIKQNEKIMKVANGK